MVPESRCSVAGRRGGQARSERRRASGGAVAGLPRALAAWVALAGLAGLALALATSACSQAPQPVTRKAGAAGARTPAQGVAGAGATAGRSSEAEPKAAAAPAAGAAGAPAGAGSAGTAAGVAPAGAAAGVAAGAAAGVPAGSSPPLPPPSTALPANAAAAAKAAPAADPSVVVVDPAEPDPESQLSLADAARAERDRKAQAPPPRIVINNKSLHRYAKGGQLTVAEPKKKQAGASPARAGQPAATAGAATVAGAPGAAPAERDEKYWRGRALEIRQRWRKAVERVKALEQDISEWRRRFYAQDDPYVRDGQIKPAWDRALDQLRDSRAEAAAAKKELGELLEEGRRAGALPGWLREGIDQEPKEEKPVDPLQPIETPIYKDNGR
jgi:hypothetical protein